MHSQSYHAAHLWVNLPQNYANNQDLMLGVLILTAHISGTTYDHHISMVGDLPKSSFSNQNKSESGISRFDNRLTLGGFICPFFTLVYVFMHAQVSNKGLPFPTLDHMVALDISLHHMDLRIEGLND